MILATLRSGETTEKLLQRFKRSVAKEGVLKDLKKRKFFEKPSAKRRRQVRELEKAILKKARKQANTNARRR